MFLKKKKKSTMGKGEIARYKCFQKTCTANTQKPELLWERVKPITNWLKNINQYHITDFQKLTGF